MRLTDRTIGSLKPKAERREVWEDGRTGLGIRISPSGRKSFIYMYRFAGKARRMTLGVYPTMGLADANVAHAEAKKMRAEGVDPGAQLVARRHAERHAETVEELIEEYLDRHARPNKRSAAADERLFRKDVLPVWGALKAKSITRRDAIKLVDQIVDRGSPVMANRALSTLRTVWNFGLDRDIVDSTPFARMRPPTRETPRDRVLNSAEISRFWNGLDQAHLSVAVRLALRFILTTAQRRSEVAYAKWSEFELDDERVWSIPAERAKNGISSRVPLSPLALDLLGQIRELSDGSTWLFPSPRNEGPIVAGAISHALRRNRGVLGIEAITPHDLRRTAVSMMTGMGISRLVVAKILNHVETGVTKVYDRYSYDAEKRHALETWGTRLKEIVTGQPIVADDGKVVALR